MALVPHPYCEFKENLKRSNGPKSFCCFTFFFLLSPMCQILSQQETPHYQHLFYAIIFKYIHFLGFATTNNCVLYVSWSWLEVNYRQCNLMLILCCLHCIKIQKKS
jgi:hypothetical protein